MVGVESIGGKCPNCSYERTFLKYGSNYTYLHIQACPNCGFALGQAYQEEPMKGKEVWDLLFEVLSTRSLKETKEVFDQMSEDKMDDIYAGMSPFKIEELSDTFIKECIWE